MVLSTWSLHKACLYQEICGLVDSDRLSMFFHQLEKLFHKRYNYIYGVDFS